MKKLVLCLVSFVLLSPTGLAAQPIITTVVGGGPNGPATALAVNKPDGVAVDATGNLFIAATNAHQVYRVDAGSGVLTVVAGTGTSGFSGDTGAAVDAQLDSPTDVAVDGSGNVYIVDNVNDRIRKVDTAATPVITTVAGGGAGFSEGATATTVQLDELRGIDVDGSGSLFFTSLTTNRVYVVESGKIGTFAGGGSSGLGDTGPATSAELNTPTDVAVDGSGNLFIADSVHHRIRKVDATTNNIDTVAGGARSASTATAPRPPAPNSSTLPASRSTDPETSTSATRATTASARSLPPRASLAPSLESSPAASAATTARPPAPSWTSRLASLSTAAATSSSPTGPTTASARSTRPRPPSSRPSRATASSCSEATVVRPPAPS